MLQVTTYKCTVIVFQYEQVYLEDALGERVWVDRRDCQLFVENILTAFNTKIPPSSMMQSEVGKSDQTASAGTLHLGDFSLTLGKHDMGSVPKYMSTYCDCLKLSEKL